MSRNARLVTAWALVLVGLAAVLGMLIYLWWPAAILLSGAALVWCGSFVLTVRPGPSR